MKFLITILLLSFTLMGHTNEDELRERIKKGYPDLIIKSINKTSFNDLYEVLVADEIIYTDENFSFLIVEGRVVDPKTKIDMTGKRLEELTRINFSNLPFEKSIKTIKGKGERKIAIFSDLDCPFCKKLEKETLSKLDNVTIYTFLFPLAIHHEAKIKSKRIWCSADREKSWNDYMLNNKLPTNKGECINPIEEILLLGDDLAIRSTPTIVLPSGKKIPGAIPLAEMREYLNDE